MLIKVIYLAVPRPYLSDSWGILFEGNSGVSWSYICDQMVAPNRADRCNVRLDAGGVHAAELLLELSDFVAEAGGNLEMELGGGGVHLIGQLGDQADELLAGDAAVRGGGIRAAADGG